MPKLNIPYNFANGSTSDANQVDQNFTAIANVVNGLDDSNMSPGTISAGIATEGVKPSQTIGIPYATDIFGNAGYVSSGLTVTKDGTNANQINVAAGVAWLMQASGVLRRLTPQATNFKTLSASATYYLDYNPDGTFSWQTGHSTQSNYITICTVTTDASANVLTITDTRPSGGFNATQLGGVAAANFARKDSGAPNPQVFANPIQTQITRNFPDTRNVNDNPGVPPSQTETMDFKTASTIGLPLGTWAVLRTITPWVDDSGGPCTQIAYSDSSNVYYRTGTRSGGWGPWYMVPNANSFTNSAAANGYTKLPNGLIIQWLTAVSVSSSGTTTNFPIAFPNNCFAVVSTADQTPAPTSPLSVTGKTKTGVTLSSSSATYADVIAIGN